MCSGGLPYSQDPEPSLLPARALDPYDWTVQFGQLTAVPSFWNLQAYRNRYQVEKIFLSPKYVGSVPFDIALLKLASSVTYSNYIQPICIPASTSKFENRTDCWVTGWGNIEEDKRERLGTDGCRGWALSWSPDPATSGPAAPP